MTNQRRTRTDTEKGLQQIVSDAALLPDKPPAGIKLNAKQRKWWDILYLAKARRAWRKQDLLALADACRIRAQIEDMRNSLTSLDPVDDLTAYEKISKLIDLAVKQHRLLCVYLQIHPEATQGKSGKQVAQNQAHNSAHDYAEGGQGDGLIARPVSH